MGLAVRPVAAADAAGAAELRADRGLREHRGSVVGPAVWEPIVTEQTRARILARLGEQTRTGRRSPRRALLSGMLRCGKCQGVLFSAARQDTRRYVCSAGPDHGGCGRLTVVAAPVEDLITRAVLLRLDSPELADALSGRAAPDEERRPRAGAG
jgi:hypothetical protein